MNRRLDVQGLRALAVLSVIAFHAGLPLPGGFIGVDVFLVISGFVITAMLLREHTVTGKLDLVRFYQRRFWRIFPALAVVITFTFAASIFLQSPFGAQQTTAATGIGAIFLAGNIAISNTTGGYFDAAAESNPLLNLWSLSVEEQFYVFFPFALILCFALAQRMRGNRTVVIAGALALSALSFAAALYGSSRELGPIADLAVGFYSLAPRAWEFGAGALIALSANSITSRLTRPTSSALSLAGIMLIGWGFVGITGETPFPSAWTLIPVAGTAFLIIAGFDDRNPVSGVLGSRPLARIGDWSYSLYLWHWPVIVFALIIWPDVPNIALWAALVSIIPAVASFRLIETPLRSRSGWPAPRRRITVVALILLPLLAGGTLAAGAATGWNRDWTGVTAQADHIAYAEYTDAAFTPAACTWPVTNSRGTILLVGDSQAYSYADGVVAAANSLGYDVVVSSISGCPFGALAATGKHVVDCADWQKQVLDFALETRPDVVMIANRSAGYRNTELGWRTIEDENGDKVTSTNAPALYEESLEPVVSAMTAAGIPVVLMQNIPSPPTPYEMESFAASTLFTQWVANDTVDSFPTGVALDSAQKSRTVEAQIAADYPVTLFDPFEYLCAGSECALGVDGYPMYLDVAPDRSCAHMVQWRDRRGDRHSRE